MNAKRIAYPNDDATGVPRANDGDSGD